MTTYKYLNNTSAHFLGVGRPLATLSTPAPSRSGPPPDLGTTYIPGVMSAPRIRVRCVAKEAIGQELRFHVERDLLKTFFEPSVPASAPRPGGLVGLCA